MLNLLLNKQLVIILVVALGAGAIYYKGKYDERNSIARKQDKADLEAFKERSRINREADNLDPFGLCLELGGLPDDCASELHGMGEAAEAE